MHKRNALWIGGIALVATLGGVAAYAAFHPALLGPVMLRSASPATAAEPQRRASRIDGDMRATFERLEKSGTQGPGSPAAAQPAAAQSDGASSAKAPAPSEATERAAAPPAMPEARPAPQPPIALAKPAKGMPVSLVPAQRATPVEAPRVMDPRMTKALDLLASTAPPAMPATAPMPGVASSVAALPDATAEAAPTVLRPPAIAPQLAKKNEAEMTADDLNAREHQRIRRTLDGAAGGTN